MKTGKLLTTLLFICMELHLHAQQDYIWAKSAGGVEKETSTSVCTDTKGNVFVAGFFYSPTITFGNHTLINTDSTGKSMDLFIVKYDGAGNVIWAINGKGMQDEAVNGICTDASDNLFITGSFGSPTLTFGTVTISNMGSINAFIIKFDASGTALWGKRGIGLNSDGVSVCTDPNGNSFIAGTFCSAYLTFDAITLTNPHLGGVFPYPDVFVVKFDVSGNALWAKSGGGYLNDDAKSICSDASGNLYFTGSFSGDTITFGSLGLHNEGYYDMFLIKYDATGKELWARNEGGTGGTGGTQGTGVCIDKEGDLLVTGFFKKHDGNFGGISLKNAGETDIFTVKYDVSGKVIWAKSVGGPGGEEGYGISTDASNNVYITGNFQSPTLTFGSATLVNGGRYNTFITKYNGAGNVLWAKSTGGTSEDFGFSISADLKGNVYAAGYFQSPVLTFGTIDLKNADTYGDSWDMFLVKIGSPNGIEETLDQQLVSIFPNPANDQITVSVASNLIGSVYHIYNHVGQEVLVGKLNSEKTMMDWQHLSAGLYLITVEGKENQLIKVVKN
jgi:hypothetical protein